MGEAKRRRLHGLGATKIEPRVDLDAAIEDFERHVEADQIKGFVQIGLLRNIAPSVSPLKLWTFGLEKQEIYDALCLMKKAMEDTMGFEDD